MASLIARTVGGATQRLRRWPVESQQVARRNAMLACTALAAHRVEREDVEDYLRDLSGASGTSLTAAHG